MKDLLLGVHVVVKTLNLEISRHSVVWHTTSKNSTKVRAARAARLFYLIYQSDHCFLALSLPSSLLKLPFVNHRPLGAYAIFRFIEILTLCSRCENQSNFSLSAHKTVVDRLER